MYTFNYELKPCPFCGGVARLEKSSRGFIGGQTTRISYVYCTSCNARSPRFKLEDFGKTSHSNEANQAAIDSWNKRI